MLILRIMLLFATSKSSAETWNCFFSHCKRLNFILDYEYDVSLQDINSVRELLTSSTTTDMIFSHFKIVTCYMNENTNCRTSFVK